MAEIGEGNNLKGLIIHCFHDPNKLQIGVLDDEVLETVAEKNGLSDDVKQKLKQYFQKTTKPQNEVKDMLLQIDPSMEKLFSIWDKSSCNQLELTSVGIAIAHANYRRKTGDTMDLSMWIK